MATIAHPPRDGLLTVKQAAKQIGVSASLVYQWCQEQLLVHYRFGSKGKRGKILLAPDDVEAFKQTCRVGPHPLLGE